MCGANACSVWIDGAQTARKLYFASTPAGLRLRGLSVELYMTSSPECHLGKRVERAVAKAARCP